MDWRLIEYRVNDPFYNMACDETIFDAFCGGWSPPTVRFYGWSRPSVSLGLLQPAVGCLSPERCGEKGVTVVRRPTGGRAVAHGTDFTFSTTLDVQSLNEGCGVASSYRRTGEAVVRALAELGIHAEFCRFRSVPGEVRNTIDCFDLRLENEVAVSGRKVLGCAQVRRGNAVLQQNSLALAAPTDEVLRILRPRHSETDASLAFDGRQYPSTEDIFRALKNALEDTFGVTLIAGELSHREMQALGRLEAKYRSLEWLQKRPIRPFAELTVKIG